MLRTATIYRLREGASVQGLVRRDERNREHKLYLALLVLASLDVFVLSAAVCVLLLLRFE